MKFLPGLVLSFLLLSTFPSAQTKSDIPLKIGAKLPSKYISRESDREVATHPNQLRPCIEKKLGEDDYTIAYDKNSLEIRYIRTFDSDFRTENGLKIGSEIAVTAKTIQVIPYFEVSGPTTPDGWRPVIGFRHPDPSDLRDGEKRFRILSFAKGGN